MTIDCQAIERDYMNHAPKFLRDQYAGIVATSGIHTVLNTVEGRQVFDFATGGFGYCVDEVAKKVQLQLRKMALSNRIMVSRRLAELVLKLNQITPPELSVSYICNSGEEAFDASLKLAKGLNPARDTLVVVRGSQPGSLSYGLLCSEHNAPLLSAFPLKAVFVDPNDAGQLQQAVTERTLAVVYEPVLTKHRCIRLSPSYLATMQMLCNSHRCLMIAYELRTGLGFTGTMLSCSDRIAVPDVVVLGNALSGGMLPVGAYVTRKEINDQVYGTKNPSLHGSTTGGNPASCAAAVAALDYIHTQRLPERHVQIGVSLKSGLDRLSVRHAIQTGEPEGSIIDIFVENHDHALMLWQCLLTAGVLLERPQDRRLIVRPALTTTLSEVDAALQAFEAGLIRFNKKTHTEVA